MIVPFEDVVEFIELAAVDSKSLLENLARQLATYAIGRPIGFSDRAEINALAERTEEKGGGTRTLIHELVLSSLFKTR